MALTDFLFFIIKCMTHKQAAILVHFWFSVSLNPHYCVDCSVVCACTTIQASVLPLDRSHVSIHQVKVIGSFVDGCKFNYVDCSDQYFTGIMQGQTFPDVVWRGISKRIKISETVSNRYYYDDFHVGVCWVIQWQFFGKRAKLSPPFASRRADMFYNERTVLFLQREQPLNWNTVHLTLKAIHVSSHINRLLCAILSLVYFSLLAWFEVWAHIRVSRYLCCYKMSTCSAVNVN